MAQRIDFGPAGTPLEADQQNLQSPGGTLN
jgi:hypothetical protein